MNVYWDPIKQMSPSEATEYLDDLDPTELLHLPPSKLICIANALYALNLPSIISYFETNHD